MNFNAPLPRVHNRFMASAYGDTAPIVSKHVWGAEGVDPVSFKNNPPSTTGAYILYEVYPDLSLFVWERIDDWWGNDIFGQPAPKYIVYGQSGTQELQVEELKNNQWDIAQLSKDLTLNVIAENTYMTYTLYPGPCFNVIEPNSLRYPMNMSAFRWVLSYTVPYHKVNVLEPGFPSLIPVKGPMPMELGILDNFVNVTALTAYGELGVYDLAEAERRLDAIDFIDRDSDGIRETPNGTILSLQFITAGDPGDWPNVFWAEWKKELAKVGIELILDYRADAHTPKVCGEFDITGFTNCGATIDGDIAYLRHHYTLIPEPDECFTNFASWGRYEDDRMQELFDLIQLVAPFSEEAKPLYDEAFDIWMRDIPEIGYQQGTSSPMFSTAYWEGWPEEGNMYVQPVSTHFQFIVMLTRIHQGDVGTQIAFEKSLEGVTTALEEVTAALAQQDTDISSLESEIVDLKATVASATTNQNLALGVAAIAIIIGMVALVWKR
jgi:peptide/nickel transport system substrate-binding protein